MVVTIVIVAVLLIACLIYGYNVSKRWERGKQQEDSKWAQYYKNEVQRTSNQTSTTKKSSSSSGGYHSSRSNNDPNLNRGDIYSVYPYSICSSEDLHDNKNDSGGGSGCSSASCSSSKSSCSSHSSCSSSHSSCSSSSSCSSGSSCGSSCGGGGGD